MPVEALLQDVYQPQESERFGFFPDPNLSDLGGFERDYLVLLFMYDKSKWDKSDIMTLQHRQRRCTLHIFAAGRDWALIWAARPTWLGYPLFVGTQPIERDKWFTPIIFDLRQNGKDLPNGSLDVLAPPDEMRTCINEANELLKSVRLMPHFARKCVATFPKAWRPDEIVTLPREVHVFREPRWFTKTFMQTLPAGTRVQIVHEPWCGLIPDIPGYPDSFSLVWPVRLPSGQIGWIFQVDVEHGIPAPSNTNENVLLNLPLPYRPAPGLPATTFAPGVHGRVCTRTDALLLRVRPGRGNTIRARLQPGTHFEVIGGPEYDGKWLWWEVRTSDGLVGWVMEGSDEKDWYYICPIVEP